MFSTCLGNCIQYCFAWLGLISAHVYNMYYTICTTCLQHVLHYIYNMFTTCTALYNYTTCLQHVCVIHVCIQHVLHYIHVYNMYILYCTIYTTCFTLYMYYTTCMYTTCTSFLLTGLLSAILCVSDHSPGHCNRGDKERGGHHH